MSLLKRFLSFFPSLYFLIFWLRYRLEISNARELVIVTTPGHVGSSTVYNTLKGVNWPKGTYLYDIHSLNERFNNASQVPSVSARHVLQEILRSKLLKSKLADKKVTIITIVRDPVARALGGMFQNSDVFIKGVKVNDLPERDFATAKEEVYHQLVNDGLLEDTINWQLEFYKNELSQFWGFDWSEMKEGHQVLHRKNHTLIVITLENLAQELQQKVNDLWDHSLEMRIANKNESEFYTYCKKEMKFDQDFLNTIYGDQFLKRIYGEHRLSEFVAKWVVQDR